MANPVRGEVDLVIGETTYTIKLGRNALASVEKLLDMGFPEIANTLDATPSFDVLRALLWAGLHQHHPDIDLMQVGDLMDEASDDEMLGSKIGEALKLTFPDSKGGNRPRKPGQRKAGATT